MIPKELIPNATESLQNDSVRMNEITPNLASGHLPFADLLPLGRNRAGLYEFWHVLSGDRPEVGEDGEYVVRLVNDHLPRVGLSTNVRRMLEEVVRPGGTGTKAAIDGYRVAGKTGTAWKFASGGYSEDKYISIFAGLAPASDPRLATVVVIDEPSGELYYGSDVAAPVFADVMSESLRLLAVPPDAMPARDPGDVLQAMTGQAKSR